MNKLISTIALTLFTAVALHAAPRYTADFYKSDPGKYLNQIVTVKICGADPSSFEAAKGYVSYHCWTAYNGERGGYIYVLVPSAKSKAFYRDYREPKSKANVNGQGVDTPVRDLRAKMVQVEWDSGAKEYVLIVQ